MNVLLEKLGSVVEMDAQAWHAFGQAMLRVDDKPLREEFSRCQADHAQHVERVSALIRKLGGVPPPFSKTFRGFQAPQFTAVCSARGEAATLRALQLCETLVHGRYDALLDIDLPEMAQNLIARFQLHERVHLRFLMQATEKRAA